ncbi:SixA phosphatase family protein [Streptomyces sp. NPDC059355]|uniref:SixA phosphatase family protein n=1 Tax=Streptomyces sp. NPDC059355 TaxID=3346811 RepID=UPI0036C3C288
MTDRGRHDAAQAGRRLAQSGVGSGLALCSPALRTRRTWQLMLPELSAPPTTVYEDKLYRADSEGLLSVAAGTSSGLTGLVVVGHKPGVRELVMCGNGPEQPVQRLIGELRAWTPSGARRRLSTASLHGRHGRAPGREHRRRHRCPVQGPDGTTPAWSRRASADTRGARRTGVAAGGRGAARFVVAAVAAARCASRPDGNRRRRRRGPAASRLARSHGLPAGRNDSSGPIRHGGTRTGRPIPHDTLTSEPARAFEHITAR